MRCCAAAVGGESAITRAGSIAPLDGDIGAGAGAGGGARGAGTAAVAAISSATKLGGSGTVRERSMTGPEGRAGAGAACGGDACGGGACGGDACDASSAPQVTQNRMLASLTLPHWAHRRGPGDTRGGTGSADAWGTPEGESVRGAKLTAGASGRRLSAPGVAAAVAAGEGAASGWASPVAASGEGVPSFCARPVAGGKPTGGVGGATRGASL